MHAYAQFVRDRLTLLVRNQRIVHYSTFPNQPGTGISYIAETSLMSSSPMVQSGFFVSVTTEKEGVS